MVKLGFISLVKFDSSFGRFREYDGEGEDDTRTTDGDFEGVVRRLRFLGFLSWGLSYDEPYDDEWDL